MKRQPIVKPLCQMAFLFGCWAIAIVAYLPFGIWRAITTKPSSNPLPDWVTEEEKNNDVLNRR